MVSLGNGQAIIGGVGGSGLEMSKEIYYIMCYDMNCLLNAINQKLSIPRQGLVAIPIPDDLAGCVSEGKDFINNILFQPLFPFFFVNNNFRSNRL